MKLLTKADYDRRLIELTDERAAAENDYRRAALALELETGDEAAVDKAKAHVERVAGRISGLHSAWAESQRLAKEQSNADRVASYNAFSSAVGKQIAARLIAIEAVRSAAAKLADAMIAFDATTPAINVLATRYAQAADLRRIPDYMGMQLDIGAVAGAVLAAGGVKCFPYGTDQSFQQLRDREAKFANGLLSHVGMMAPAPDVPPQPKDPGLSTPHDFAVAMGMFNRSPLPPGDASPDKNAPPPGVYPTESPNAGPASGWAAEQESA